jgi:hypothetical protein
MISNKIVYNVQTSVGMCVSFLSRTLVHLGYALVNYLSSTGMKHFPPRYVIYYYERITWNKLKRIEHLCHAEKQKPKGRGERIRLKF